MYEPYEPKIHAMHNACAYGQRRTLGFAAQRTARADGVTCKQCRKNVVKAALAAAAATK